MQLSTIDQKIFSMAESAAQDWFKRQCANTLTSMYAYYKPGEIAFYIGENALNDNWKLIAAERVSIAWTPKQLTTWLIDKAQRLPIIPQEA